MHRSCPAPRSARGCRQAEAFLTNDANAFLDAWRTVAQATLANNPRGPRGNLLSEKVQRWRSFAVEGRGDETEWPVLDICYSFLPWFRPFQDDPEAQVYLEAITRTVAAASTFSGYKAAIQRDEPHRTRSVNGAIRDVLNPIAENLVAVDEEIMPSVPRDRLNIMTIHQAKGLEFPLVIVDVSSDFKTNHRTQRFRRFPDEESSVVRLEDDLANVDSGSGRHGSAGLGCSVPSRISSGSTTWRSPATESSYAGRLPTGDPVPHGYQERRQILAAGRGTWAWISDPRLRPPPVFADLLPFTRI